MDGKVSDERPIAQNPAPPPHTPTSSVPASLLASLPDALRERQRAAACDLLGRLRPSLGEPCFAEDGFILYHGDCLELMPKLVGAGLPLTITSPPYNIGKAYEQATGLDEYVAWTRRWLASARALTAREGALWLNLGYVEVPGKGRAVPLPYLLWDASEFYLLQEVVWNYGAGVATRRSFTPRNEKWLFYVADPDRYTFHLDEVRDPRVKYPNQKKNGKFRCNPRGKNPTDVWQFAKVTSGAGRSSKERTPHPAQFPLAMIERIVRVSSDPGDVVFDPFAGSGSTGIAALGAGRVFLGFEQRADYCALAAERYRSFADQRARARD